MAHEILFCYRGVTENLYQSNIPHIQGLIKECFSEAQYKITPLLINPNNMNEIVKQHSFSFFSPPIAIFYDCNSSYGRLDDLYNWLPLIGKCKYMIVLHVLDPLSPTYNVDKNNIEQFWKSAYSHHPYKDKIHKILFVDSNQQTLTPQQIADMRATDIQESQQRNCCVM